MGRVAAESVRLLSKLAAEAVPKPAHSECLRKLRRDGFGITEHRSQEPSIFNPHGFSLAVLRAEPGKAMLQHRVTETQVLIVRKGRWEIRLNESEPVTVTLEENDTLSIPVGAWREFANVGDETGELYIVTGGDSRAKLEWDELILKGAQNEDVAYDANGYLAPWSIVSTSTMDD